MFFNKPLYTPNIILVESPVSGDKRLDIVFEIIDHLNLGKQLVVLCASDNIFQKNKNQIIIEQYDYTIYRERDTTAKTLASQILKKNPGIVYCISADSDGFKAAISNVCDLIGTNYPILCVSQNLSSSINPACIIVPELSDKQMMIENNNSFNANNILTLNELLDYEVVFESNLFSLQHLQLHRG